MDWQARVSRPDAPAIEVHSPLHRRSVWLTPREYAVAARAGSGRTETQRSIARAVGYSLAGAENAIRQLERLGIVGTRRKRGRLGMTRLWLRLGAVVVNVRSLVERRLVTLSEETENVVDRVRTLSRIVFAGPGVT